MLIRASLVLLLFSQALATPPLAGSSSVSIPAPTWTLNPATGITVPACPSGYQVSVSTSTPVPSVSCVAVPH